MVRRLILAFVGLLILVPCLAQAQTDEVPHYVNFQAVLRDDSGNLIEDGFVDLSLKILDQDGTEVYDEVQPGAQVVRSAINVMIGEGIEPGSSPSAPMGGIPFDALDPAAGSMFLQIQFGSNLPSEPMELGSVPYAMYAQRALGLAPNILSDEVPDVFVTEDELAAAIAPLDQDPSDDLTTATVFGGDVSGTYDAISVADDSHNHTGATISGLSTSDFTSSNISQWTNDAGYITSSTADGNYVNVTGDTMTGALSMGGNDVTNVGMVDGVDLNHANSALNSDGSIKGGGYSAIGFRTCIVAHGDSACIAGCMPTGFTTADCGNMIFLPSLRQYEGDGGGTERVEVWMEAPYNVHVKADSRANGTGSDGKLPNLATVLVIATR